MTNMFDKEKCYLRNASPAVRKYAIDTGHIKEDSPPIYMFVVGLPEDTKHRQNIKLEVSLAAEGEIAPMLYDEEVAKDILEKIKSSWNIVSLYHQQTALCSAELYKGWVILTAEQLTATLESTNTEKNETQH